MNVERSQIDDAVGKLKSILMPYFDHVGEAYIFEDQRHYAQGMHDVRQIEVSYIVRKGSRKFSVAFPIKITECEIIYGVTGRCVNTGTKFNLTHADIAAKLTPR